MSKAFSFKPYDPKILKNVYRVPEHIRDRPNSRLLRIQTTAEHTLKWQRHRAVSSLHPRHQTPTFPCECAAVASTPGPLQYRPIHTNSMHSHSFD